jgi:hypothetical protein
LRARRSAASASACRWARYRREHQQPPPLLPQRLVRDQRLQLRYEQRGLAAVEPCGEQPLPGDRPQLGQPGDLRLRPGLARVLAQRRAAPELERLGEQLGGARGSPGRGGPGVADQPLEPPGVDRVGRQPDGVAEPALAMIPPRERGAPVRLEPRRRCDTYDWTAPLTLPGGRRPTDSRRCARRDDLPAGEDQHGEDSTLTATAEVDLASPSQASSLPRIRTRSPSRPAISPPPLSPARR